MRVEWVPKIEVILDETVPEDEMWLCGGPGQRHLIAKFTGVVVADLGLAGGGEEPPPPEGAGAV